MHPEAYDGFGWALKEAQIDPSLPHKILDIGGQMVNGSVHDYFTHPETTVTTLDLENADIIADATIWEPTDHFDLVIATELFEHVSDWPAVVETMRRALDPDGLGVLLTTCASTNRRPHGATGALHPAPGEWYGNVDPLPLREVLQKNFEVVGVDYLYPPGDAYAWAKGPRDIS